MKRLLISLFFFLGFSIFFSPKIQGQFIELRQNIVQIDWGKEMPKYWLSLLRKEEARSVWNYIPFMWEFNRNMKFFRDQEYFPGIFAFSYAQVKSEIVVNLEDAKWISYIRVNTQTGKIDTMRTASQAQTHLAFVLSEIQQEKIKAKIKEKIKQKKK